MRAVVQSAARAVVVAAVVLGSTVWPAAAQDGFPFNSELTLDAAPMRGSKRIPNLEIGNRGEVIIELWCKGARGQFSVAGDTIVFVPGAVDDRGCPADRAAADDALLAAIAETTAWRRQGEALVLIGPKPLRFRLNTN